MKPGKPPFRTLFATVLALACTTQAAATTTTREAAEALDPRQVCATLVATAEHMTRLPRFLLHAISLAESGRWDAAAQASFAWPWTVYAEGRGRYYPTREAALASVRALQARGVRNIDVGCMQVNLMHHGRHFESVEQALDPVHNVAYAAQLLRDLRQDRRSWSTAVAHYHSATPELGKPYWRKVYALWTQERQRDFRARREARMNRVDAARQTRGQAVASAAAAGTR
jgi:hypothetical protein